MTFFIGSNFKKPELSFFISNPESNIRNKRVLINFIYNKRGTMSTFVTPNLPKSMNESEHINHSPIDSVLVLDPD